MNAWQKARTRLLNWEFWPFYIFYIPVFIYYLILSVRNGSFFYFTAANPCMEFGGMLGEKKSDIYALLPKDTYPATLLVDQDNPLNRSIWINKYGFPLVAKPNIGERGNRVEVLRNSDDLNAYQASMKVPFLLQEFIEYPVELGVFYIRHPNQNSGKITSLVMKNFLSVTGDGQSTVEELIKSKERAQLQLNLEHSRFQSLLRTVPTKGEIVVVEPIGNHCRGTMFLDANHEIDDQLTDAIDQLAKQIDGFYYGRFDLKCASMSDLRQLKNFKVVELNGVGAEPAHIYQPGFSLWKAYAIVLWHFREMSRISRKNKKLGNSYWGFTSGVKKIADIRAYNRIMLSQ